VDGQACVDGSCSCGDLPGDLNEDGAEDQLDRSKLVACLTGPGQPTREDCLCADKNGDGRIDLIDVAALLRRR
jgi:hypothetical protein